MNFFQKIASGLADGTMPAAAGQPSWRSRAYGAARAGVPLLQPVIGSIWGREISKDLDSSLSEAADKNPNLSEFVTKDPTGGRLFFPEAAAKTQQALDTAANSQAFMGGSLPLLAGKGGLPLAGFYGAAPLVDRRISKWKDSSFMGALNTVPQEQRDRVWAAFTSRSPQTHQALKEFNPNLYQDLSGIKSRAEVAESVNDAVFNQWNGPRVGSLPLHVPAAERLAANTALKTTGSFFSRLGMSAAGNSLKRLATASPQSALGLLVPTKSLLLRGAGAGVATLGTNALNSAAGGIGAPAVADPVTGRDQYEGDVPWWHHSLRGIRSSIAGGIGGSVMGPAGAIAGAVVNPVSEAWGDISEIASSWKDHNWGQSSAERQAQLIEDGRRAWRASETAAKHNAAVAQTQARNSEFMKSFANYRTALGIGVGAPLAGLLLYKMFSSRKKKPAKAPEDQSPELT